MSLEIRRVDYFYTTIKDQPGEAFKVLTRLAAGEVDLLAFSAVPAGPDRSQLTLFPRRVEHLAEFAARSDLVLDGPHPALLVQGDDRLGALAEIHERLFRVKINVYASTGVIDGGGSFGYLIYLQPQQVDAAVAALQAMAD